MNICYLPIETRGIIINCLDIKSFISFSITCKNNYYEFYNEKFIKFYLKSTFQTIWSFIHYSSNNKVLFNLINDCYYSGNTNLIKNDSCIIYMTFINIYKYNPDIIIFLSYYGYTNICLVYYFISKKEYYLAYIVFSCCDSRAYKHFICIILLIREKNKNYYKDLLYDDLYFRLTAFERYLIDSINIKKLILLE